MKMAVVVLLTGGFFATTLSAEVGTGSVPAGEAGGQQQENTSRELKVRAGGGQGGTSMHWMAFNGDVAGVSRQIVAGADIDGRLKTGGTPLHLAAYRGHTGVVRLLIEHGARVNARTKAGVTPLDWARRNGHEEVASLLIAHGGRPGKGGAGRLQDAPAAGQGSGETPESGGAPAPRKFSLLGLPPEGSVVVIREPNPAVARAEKDTGPKTPAIEKADATATGSEDPQPAQKAAEASAPEPAVTGSYRIQLGAFGSEKRAVDAWSLFQKRHPQLLGGRGLLLDKVEVKGKTLFRVQTGPLERSDAWSVCGELKAAGQSCAVMKRGPS